MHHPKGSGGRWVVFGVWVVGVLRWVGMVCWPGQLNLPQIEQNCSKQKRTEQRTKFSPGQACYFKNFRKIRAKEK